MRIGYDLPAEGTENLSAFIPVKVKIWFLVCSRLLRVIALGNALRIGVNVKTDILKNNTRTINQYKPLPINQVTALYAFIFPAESLPTIADT